MCNARKLLFIIGLLVFGINLSYASCSNVPTSIEVSSGSVDLGDFSSGDTAYVNFNLQSKPVKVKIHYFHTTETCFDDATASVKLFQTGSPVIGSLVKSDISGDGTEFETIANLEIKTDLVFDQLDPIFEVTGSQISSSVNLKLRKDENDPTITRSNIVGVVPNQVEVVKSGHEAVIRFSASDSESGLASVEVRGVGFSKDFSGESTSGDLEASFTITGTTQLTVVATDLLGNQKFGTPFIFEVDNQKPVIENFAKSGYTFSGSSQRYVSFYAMVSDKSFDNGRISAVFEGMENSEEIDGVCSESDMRSDLYECTWENIQIPFDTTQAVKVTITAIDGFENSIVTTKTSEIFVDKQEPEITRFEMVNSLGVKNILSPYDNNTLVYLEYTDSSFDEFGLAKPEIYGQDFDRVNHPIEEIECEIKDGGCMIWNISDHLLLYEDDLRENAYFYVGVVDYYRNIAYKNLSFVIDNELPEVHLIEIEETESVKDQILKSGENINIRLVVSDENLESISGDFFISGDFREISTNGRDHSNVRVDDCYELNDPVEIEELGLENKDGLYECYFEDLVLTTGYIKTNVTFTVYDSAGNNVNDLKEFEIFKKVDAEVPEAYEIEDLVILNPLNRNLLRGDSGAVSQGVYAWFEGEILKKDDDRYNNLQIVSYYLIGCNRSAFNQPHIVEESLYPNINTNTVIGNITEFILRIQLGGSSLSLGDLNEQSTQCSIAFELRDEENVYNENLIVNFNVLIKYYDIPRGDIVSAHTTNLLKMIDDAEKLGSWFDDTYELYITFEKVCSGLTTVNSAFSVIGTIWTPISIILHNTGIFEGIALAGDRIIYPVEGTLTSVIWGAGTVADEICPFVTCRYSSKEGLYSGGVQDVLGKLQDAYTIAAGGGFGNWICSGANDLINSVSDNSQGGES